MKNHSSTIRRASYVLALTLFGAVLQGLGQPVITSQPTNQTVIQGGLGTFGVTVSGIGPFTYQWQLNGTNLPNFITTVAGNGVFGYNGDGIIATNAAIRGPVGVTLDSLGDLYISDGGNGYMNGNRIRKVDTNGIITTVAGNGNEGYSGDGVAATNTSLCSPSGVAFDFFGNLYIGDAANQLVRKVDTNGIISTIAGNYSRAFTNLNGGYSGDGGLATNATLNYPFGIAIDSFGDVYIADSGNNRVRMVDTNGTITTVAGNGTADYSGDNGAATNAALNNPLGVSIDTVGNLYIADSGNNRIRLMNTNGIIFTVAGGGSGGDGGAATNANLNNPLASVNTPLGVAMDAFGNLYIADGNKCSVRRVNTNGIISTVVGNGSESFGGDGGAATNASLNVPYGVTWGRQGDLYVADTGNNRVRKVHLTDGPTLYLPLAKANDSGSYQVVITGAGGSITSAVATLTVVFPPVITIQPFCTNGGNAVINLSASGTPPLNYLWYFDNTNLLQSSTNSLLSVANLDPANINRYAVAVTNNFGNATSQAAVIAYPPSIGVQPSSQTNIVGSAVSFNVVAAGTGPFTYQWQYNGTNLTNTITTVAGNGNFPDSGDGGPATAAGMQPSDVAVDAFGNLLICDMRGTVRKVNSSGIVTTAASGFYYPQGLAPGVLGGFLVADTDNNVIVEVDSNGVHTTVTGIGPSYPASGSFAGDGAAATNANLNFPFGLNCDAYGNVFIADTSNNRIRMIGTNGIINTVVGSGVTSLTGDGGAATNAGLSSPRRVISDTMGNLWIAETGNNCIREVDTNGIIHTMIGTGTAAYTGDGGAATNASLNAPAGLAFDAFGNLLVADMGNNCIRKVNTAGAVVTEVGNGYSGFAGDGGAAINANLKSPAGLAFDSHGGLYFADTGNYRVRKVWFADNPGLSLTGIGLKNEGNYSVVVTGSYGSVTSSIVSLVLASNPPSILMQPTNQTVFPGASAVIGVMAAGTKPLQYLWYFNTTNLVQSSASAALVFNQLDITNQGGYVVVVTNNYGSVTSRVAVLAFPPLVTSQPTGQISFAGSNCVYNVAASGYGLLTYQWQLNGTNVPCNIIATVAGGGLSNPGNNGPATNASLNWIGGIASDSLGNLYIADQNRYRIQKVDSNGIITTLTGNGTNVYSGDNGSATNAGVVSPDSVAIDSSGNLFFAEYSGHRIRKVGTNGIITTVAGNGTNGYSGDGGPATNAMLNYPQGIALDTNGCLYIADYYNNRVRRVDQSGTITTVAGNGSFNFSGDGGPATNATLRYPDGVLVDSANNLYIADHNNMRVRRVDAMGVITTVVGNGNSAFSGDGGAATNAGLYYPCGMTMDSFGYLFVADQGHYRIRQIDPFGTITTVAGNGNTTFSGDGGSATSAGLNWPAGVAVAASGGLLIADEQNNRIRSITLARSPLLNVTRATATNAGNYAVTVANAFGSVTSGVAPLTVVSLQLSNLVLSAGSNEYYSASVAGPVPVFYQWQFNDADLPNATNAALSITNVQPPNQGSYDLVVSSSNGILKSPKVTLTVTGLPPANVTISPSLQLFTGGSNFTFTVSATGSPFLTYHWQCNGTNITWATTSSLTLSNAQTANEGLYAVVVTNYFGSVTSSYALFSDLAAALDNSGLTWISSGQSNWFPETTITHDGFEAAQSGLVANGQSSTLQTTVTGPGTLTFWWMFSPLTSPFPNTLSFSSSLGNASASVNSTTGWQQKTVYLGAGQQTLTWNYSRYSFTSAQSTGWVDQVSFTPGTTLPTVTSMSPNAFVRAGANITFSVGAYGTPPLTYQWQLNDTNLLNKTNTFLSLTGLQPTNAGMYSVIITNSFGSIATNAALWVGQFALNTGSTNLFSSTNGFQLNLGGVLSTNPVVIFGSTDLVNWLPLFTNSATTGTVQFLDVTATNLPTRFYRAQE